MSSNCALVGAFSASLYTWIPLPIALVGGAMKLDSIRRVDTTLQAEGKMTMTWCRLDWSMAGVEGKIAFCISQ
jgi:hypothetical protein